MATVVEFVRTLPAVKRGNGLYVEVEYKNLTGNYKGQVWKKGNFVSQIEEASRDLLKTLAAGEKIELGLETIEKEGKKYYNLKSIKQADTTQTTKVNYTTKETYRVGDVSHTKEYKKYDDTGVKVGAARNQAIAFLTATKGKSYTLDDVDATAYEIVKRQAKQEETVRSGGVAVEEVGEEVYHADENDSDLEF